MQASQQEFCVNDVLARSLTFHTSTPSIEFNENDDNDNNINIENINDEFPLIIPSQISIANVNAIIIIIIIIIMFKYIPLNDYITSFTHCSLLFVLGFFFPDFFT